jgi:virginiamycin B lyase
MHHPAPRSVINSLSRTSGVLLVASLMLLGAESRANTSPHLTEYNVPTANAEPYDITLGPDGNMWFTEENAKIARITLTGGITEFTIPTKNAVAKLGTNQPDCTPTGRLWFFENIGTIGNISASDAIQERPLGKGIIMGLTCDSNGNLWFIEWERRAIDRIEMNGMITDFSMPHDGYPQGIIADKDHNIWFAENYETGEMKKGWLERIDRYGKIITYPLQSVHANPSYPWDWPIMGYVGVATDGSVWFAEDGFNRIGKRPTTGTITEYAIPTPDSGIFFVVGGPRGDAWFTEGHANKFGHVTADGKITEYKIPTPKSEPSGIAIDNKGNVWITEFASNKILKAGGF